jgi:hypothetical protein
MARRRIQAVAKDSGSGTAIISVPPPGVKPFTAKAFPTKLLPLSL